MEMDPRALAVIILVAAFAGALASMVVSSLIAPSPEKMIRDFYLSESAAVLSPTDYLNELKSGKQDMLMVDLRTVADYQAGHLVGAINIPAEGMNDAQLVAAFRAVPSNRTIITYCYAEHCTLSAKVGLVLANNGIFVKHSTTGALENARDFADYIVKGPQPGVYMPGPGGQFICSAQGGNFTC